MVMFDPAAMSQGLDVPAKTLPVPGTPSPQIQQLINAPLRPGWNALPKSDQEWRQVVATGAAATLKTLPGLIDRMKVKVEKTRDLLLSNTVRVHRKLRQAGVEAALQIFEGQSHAHYLRDDSAPETKEAFAEISEFFDKHMAKQESRGARRWTHFQRLPACRSIYPNWADRQMVGS